MEEIVFFGTHGTHRDNVSSIQQKGFENNPGMAGTGIYFWANEDGDINVSLAKKWNEDRNINPKDRRVIVAEIRVAVQEYMDLEKLRSRIYELAVERKINLHDRKKLPEIFNTFIEREEKKQKRKIKVYTIKVPPPKSFGNYPFWVLGAPLCCVARKRDCVRILRIIENGNRDEEQNN